MNAPIADNHHAHPYGVGLAYRYNCHDDYIRYQDEIDLMEISTEDYIVRERRLNADPNEELLRDALERWPSVAHGISLSIGTVEPLNEAYMTGTNRFMNEHGINVFSEHMAFHTVDGNDLTMFLCMPFTEDAVQWVKQNYYAVRRQIGRPFALENVTYFFSAPHSEMTEAEFLKRLTEETDCSLLLDVTNVYNNATNHGYDAEKFIDTLPLERVSQMHLAGGIQKPDGRWEDSHSHPVMEGVWPLYEKVLERSPAEIVVVERDSRFNPYEEVQADVQKARELFYKYRPEKPTGPVPNSQDMASDPFGENAISKPLASEFAGLKKYQQALMARICDSDFREQFRQNPPEALKSRFDITDDGLIQSLSSIDPDILYRLQSGWDYIAKENEELADDYEQSEWAAWADILEEEEKIGDKVGG